MQQKERFCSIIRSVNRSTSFASALPKIKHVGENCKIFHTRNPRYDWYSWFLGIPQTFYFFMNSFLIYECANPIMRRASHHPCRLTAQAHNYTFRFQVSAATDLKLLRSSVLSNNKIPIQLNNTAARKYKLQEFSDFSFDQFHS